MPTPYEQFVQTVGGLAQKLGIAELLIISRDPRTRVVSYMGSPGSLRTLRPDIAEKLQLVDSSTEVEAMTGWES
jgi:hypothetical protein